MAKTTRNRMLASLIDPARMSELILTSALFPEAKRKKIKRSLFRTYLSSDKITYHARFLFLSKKKEEYYTIVLKSKQEAYDAISKFNAEIGLDGKAIIRLKKEVDASKLSMDVNEPFPHEISTCK